MVNTDGSLTELAKKYKKVEELADLIDRGLAPLSREEFGKEMKPASRWLKQPADRKIVAYYEAHPEIYEKIVKGRHYENVWAKSTCNLKGLLTK